MYIEYGQPTAFDPLLCKFKFSDKVAPTMCSTNFHANINTDIKPNFLLLKGPEQQLNIIYINQRSKLDAAAAAAAAAVDDDDADVDVDATVCPWQSGVK